MQMLHRSLATSHQSIHLQPTAFEYRKSIPAKAIAIAMLVLAIGVPVKAVAQVSAPVTFAGSQVTVVTGLSSPTGLASDGIGNLYIADTGNNRIVSVALTPSGFATPQPVISGLSSPLGVASDWNGDIYVADTGNNRILVLPNTPNGYGSPVAVQGNFDNPAGVAVDAYGNIFVADSGNNRVVELPSLGGGGYGAPIQIGSGFNNPMGVALDSHNNVFVLDSGNNRVIKEFWSTTGYITPQRLGSGLSTPTGLAVDQSRDVYIADSQNGRVVEEPWFVGGRYNPQLMIAGDLSAPSGMTSDWSGNIYVSDSRNNRIVKLTSASVNFGAFNVGSSGTDEIYDFAISAGVTLGSVGIFANGLPNMDFQDAGGSSCTPQTYSVAALCVVHVKFAPLGSGLRTGAVVLYDASGNSLATAYISGVGNQSQIAFLPGTTTNLGTQLSGPSGVAVDGYGNVFIADTGNNRIVEVAWTGTNYSSQTTLPVSALNSPSGLAIDAANNLYIVSTGNNKVLKLPWTGSSYGAISKLGTGFYGPSSITIDSMGNAYVAESLTSLLWQFPWTGSGYGITKGRMADSSKDVTGVAVDSVGNVYFTLPALNAAYVAPFVNNQYLRELHLATQGVSSPTGIALDNNSNLYIVDRGNNRVVMLPWNGSAFGNQITVAAGFNAPTAIAIDTNGNLYVADTGNNQVVKIDLSTPAAQTFATNYVGSSNPDGPGVITIENIGNQPLTLDSVTYPADFSSPSALSTSCIASMSILQGTSCTLSIDFTPTVAQSPISEQITISDNTANNPEAQQTISVSGTALAKASQAILFPAVSNVVYGAPAVALAATATSGLPVSYTVVSGPALLSGKGNTLAITGVGSVVLQATQSGSNIFSAAPSVTLSFIVSPASLIVTPVNLSIPYGSTTSSFSYTITGLVYGQSAAKVISGSASVTCVAGATTAAGVYTLTASLGTLQAANYVFTFATGTLNVNKAVLTIRAASVSTPYGVPLPPLTWTLSGLIHGDTINVIQGSPVLVSIGNSGSPIGTYSITPSVGTLSSANYTFSFVPGTLTVVPNVLTVIAVNQTTVYGGAIPQLTYILSGFVQGDTPGGAVSGIPSIVTSAVIGSAAGSYSIVPALGNLTSQHYTFNFVSGVLTIGKAALTVVPANLTATYGGSLPVLSYNISGFVKGDLQSTAVSGAPQITTTAKTGSPAGSYPVQVAAGTLISKNYKFAFSTGSITVNKAPLTVIADSHSAKVGTTLPALTFTVSGYVKSDTAATATRGIPALATTISKAAQAGAYPISISAGTMNSANYQMVFVTGTLTVTK